MVTASPTTSSTPSTAATPAAATRTGTTPSPGNRGAGSPGNRGVGVEIRAVSHGFQLHGQPLPVLDDVSFTAEPGSFVALLGPSGCGKSTLLRLVAGLDSPSRGTVLADGQSISGPDPSRVVVFQDPSLFPWRTVEGNVRLGLEARRVPGDRAGRVRQALDLVGLAEFAKAHPHHLSGGMAQRTALARALVNEPSVLILDEPLGQLDSLTRLTMQSELVRLWQQEGFTGLLVTHDVEEALILATRILVLSERPARVVADLAVDLPYPRHRDDTRLQHLRAEVLQLMGFGD